MTKRVLLPIVPALACAALFAAPALAADSEAVSQNWSGYEVSSGNSDGFSDVSGSWVVPKANCTASSGATYSAFWVGLGGASSQSDSLEQDGTQSDCDANGNASYYAWYELVPSAPVQVNLTIHPGDRVTSSVHVSGSSVTMSMTDKATGDSFTKTLSMSNPDTSTAEWIAEAPSECQNGANGTCEPLPLADFGSVKFTSASATSDGHTGTISDSNWTNQALALSPTGGTDSSAGAQPSSLSSDGSYFTVNYEANGAEQVSTSDPSTSSSGSSGGYDPGSGYGYSDGSGSGYSDGSGSGTRGSAPASDGSGYGYSDGSGYTDGSGYGYSDGSGYTYVYPGGYGGGGGFVDPGAYSDTSGYGAYSYGY